MTMEENMTYEEKQKRIKELQNEINELRSAGTRCIRPKSIKGKYGWLEACGEERTHLSKLICQVCFPKTQKSHLHHYRFMGDEHPVTKLNYSYTITVKEMDDEQYARYCEIVEKVAEILDSYRNEERL